MRRDIARNLRIATCSVVVLSYLALGTTEEYGFAVVLVEPYTPRRDAALGFDMYSEDTRREAIAQARDSGDVFDGQRLRQIGEHEMFRCQAQRGLRRTLESTDTQPQQAQQQHERTIERLEKLAWWDWSHDTLHERLDDFRKLPAADLLDRYENLHATVTPHHLVITMDDVAGVLLQPHLF